MTAPAVNQFNARISSVAEGTRPAAAFGATVTPGNNAYGTAVELIASNHAGWSGNGDAHEIEVNINSNGSANAARDALVTIVYRRVISGVDTTDNEIDFAAAHCFALADVVRVTTSGVAPAGLSAGTAYYAIPRSSTSVALATSEANARAGTAIDITDAGSGTHTAHCDKIQYLSAASANTYNAGSPGGHNHRFPLLVPNGTAIDAKAMVNNGTVGTLNVSCRLHLAPTAPSAIRTGTYVRAFGAVPAASAGTNLTWGTASEGSYTELGTIADSDLWYWTGGFGINNTVQNANLHEIDIAIGADAGSAVPVLERICAQTTTTEVCNFHGGGAVFEAANGHKVFARGQVGASGAVTDTSALAYAVGGYAVAGVGARRVGSPLVRRAA